MKSKLYPASTIAVAATLLTAVASAQGSGAVAQDTLSGPAKMETLQTISEPVLEPVPSTEQTQAPAQAEAAVKDGAPVPTPASLDDLVAAAVQADALSPEMRCLAGAIYFEAKSESLPGQLAVGRVIVNRSKSGRFPASYCGVVYQPSQFSFVRGRSMPAINTASRDWREAVAIARIADAGTWRSPVEGALFFHAARVSPSWHATRIARIGNHVFYR